MKSIYNITGIILSIFLTSMQSNAATLVETEESDAGVQKMWIEGSKMRVEMGQGKEYMLADYTNNKILIVDPDKKEIMDVSHFASGGKDATQGLNVRVQHLGAGPTIAGYATQKYAMSVNGRTCNQTLVSPKALKDANLSNLLEAIAQVDFNPMGAQFMDECDRADIQFAKRMKKLGMPLATIEKNGQMTNKVKRIVKNAVLPAGGFNLPKGYRQVSMQDKMQEAMGAAMQGSKGGQMTPEMKKMMQDMMRQQGQ